MTTQYSAAVVSQVLYIIIYLYNTHVFRCIKNAFKNCLLQRFNFSHQKKGAHFARFFLFVAIYLLQFLFLADGASTSQNTDIVFI